MAKTKPPRKPRWDLGMVVATRHAVRIRKPLFRRRWLYLLPGAEWTVMGVERRGERAPVYTLTCYGHEITRAEWRLMPIGDAKRASA